MIKPCACGKRVTEPGSETCFRCRVATIGFAFRGGAVLGHEGFHKTKREHLREHVGAEFEKEILKNPNVAKAD